MAWVDTYLRLKGGPGDRGQTGPVGLRGRGMRHVANVLSYEPASSSGVFNITGSERPYTFSSSFAPTPVPALCKDIIVDSAGNTYILTTSSQLLFKPYNVNTYIILLDASGNGIVNVRPSLNFIAPQAIALDRDTNVLYIVNGSTSSPSIYALENINNNFTLDSAVLPSVVLASPLSGEEIESITLTKSFNTGEDFNILFLLSKSRIFSIKLGGTSPPVCEELYDIGFNAFIETGITSFTDSSRNVYLFITTTNKNVIEYKISTNGATSTITQIAGIGYATGGETGLDTDPLRTSLLFPKGIVYQPSIDTLYFTDQRNLCRISNYFTNPSNRRLIRLPLLDVTGVMTIETSSGIRYLSDAGTSRVSTFSGLTLDTSGNLYISLVSESIPVVRLTTWDVDILEPGTIPLDGDFINWSYRSINGRILDTSQWLYSTTQGNAILSTYEKPGNWILIRTSTTGPAHVGSIGETSLVTGATGPAGYTQIGPRGPQGPAQEFAPAGPRGATGIEGAIGPRGETGFAGEYGDVGPAGYVGPIGAEGDQGQKGARGPQGVRHANFYKNEPFPTISFPADGMPGDYYIKNDSEALYFYSEAIPDDTYYLNRIINTSDLDSYGIPVENVTGDPSLNSTIPTPSVAETNYTNNLNNYKQSINEYYAATLEQRNTNPTYLNSVKNTRKQFETARAQLEGSRFTPRRFVGPSGGWGRDGFPYLYEFNLAVGSRRTSGGDDFTNKAQYAFVFIDKTFIPGIFVVAGNKNPLDSRPVSTPYGSTLYIMSMIDLSGMRPDTQFQIMWLPRNELISPIISDNSILGTFIGTSVKEVDGSTTTQNNGYILSTFFVDYNLIENPAVKYTNHRTILSDSVVSMLYAKNGFPIKGNHPDQFAWTITHYSGGLMELQLQLNQLDLLSSRYTIPTVPGTYAILDNTITRTNTPVVITDNNISLVNTIQHPQLTIPISGSTRPVIYNETNSIPTAVTTDRFGNVYVARYLNAPLNRSIIIRLPKESLQTNNYVYNTSSIILGVNPVGTTATDGTLAVNTYAGKIYGLTTDAQGRIYYSDTEKHCIRRINLNQTVETIAGVYNSSGTDGIGQAVKLYSPHGIYYDSAYDYLYVADRNNHRVVRYSFDTQIIQPTFIIGGGANNRPGVQPFIESPLSEVLFCAPESVILDENGFLYVADSMNAAVWKIDLDTETSRLFAGTWNHAGYDVGLTPEPPPPMDPWEIFDIVMTVISVVAVVATAGASLSLLAASAARTVVTRVVPTLVRQVGFRTLVRTTTKTIIPNTVRALSNRAIPGIIRTSSKALIPPKSLSTNALKEVSRRTLQIGKGGFTNPNPTVVTAYGSAGQRWAAMRSASNAANAKNIFIPIRAAI